jgi:hypothetical protein
MTKQELFEQLTATGALDDSAAVPVAENQDEE